MNDVNEYISHSQESMEKAIEHLNHELSQIRTGKASPAVLGGVMVSYYGSPTPLNQVANVATADARTITIQPWEKNMLGPIEKAIFESNMGMTPMNDGELIRISIPPLTEERRKDLVKKAKSLGEEAKISIRNARRDAMEHVKKAVKDGLPEDAGKKLETDIQDITNSFNERVDKLIVVKEKDIMTI